ncbi:hypothetical protein Cni_G21327 [Canna indica]|uniref:BZIP domain-containing protein n=1 Tax=Canna indica TaxID=4628 RepID=A0AAQ3KQM6_9LILI|nr:hypothetical protein Cni_G21327 [Canna indica]
MASPSGTSSGSSLLENSGSEEDLHALMDQKKRKRMISNRESAKRSRMRKQKQLADLMAEAEKLRKENNNAFTLLNITKQQYSAVAFENSVLRAQAMEFRNRLQSLSEILHILKGNNISSNAFLCDGSQVMDDFISPWNLRYISQPIMASADNMLYY